MSTHFIPTIPNATQPVSRGGEVGLQDRSQATLVVMKNRYRVSILKHTGSGGANFTKEDFTLRVGTQTSFGTRLTSG